MANNKKIDAITAMEDDFAKWYTDVCRKAELMDYSSIKGFIFYRPYGYALWERVKEEFDKKIKESGHDNVYMPTTTLLSKYPAKNKMLISNNFNSGL